MKNKFYCLFLSLFFSITAFSQEDGLSYFGKFQVGVNVGNTNLFGDVEAFPSLSLGIQSTLALSPRYAFRASTSFQEMTGIDYYIGYVATHHNRTIEALGYNNFVYNYNTQLLDFDLVYLFTPRIGDVDFYIGAGLNYHLYNVRFDALDQSGSLYDFTALEAAITDRGGISKDDYEIINNILDGLYETDMLTDKNFERSNAFGLSIQLGFNYHLKNNLSIGLHARHIRSTQDNLDGFRDQDKNDRYLNISLAAAYNFYNYYK